MSPFFGQDGATYSGGTGSGGGHSMPHYAGGLGLNLDDVNNHSGRYRGTGDEEEALFPLTVQTTSTSGEIDGFRSLTSMTYAAGNGGGSPGSLPSHSPSRFSPNARGGQPRSKSFDSSGGTLTLR